MNLKSQMKPVFAQPLSYITLSIITAISISPLVLAAPEKAPEQSAEKFACREILSNKEPKQIQKLAQFSDTDSPERSQMIQQANALYNQGELAGAADNLCRFIKKFPQDAFGHFQLGNVFFRQTKPEAAVSAYQEAIRLKPEYALAYNAIGAVYASQSRWDDAITEYQKALKINPNYGDALINLGEAQWQTNKKAEAQASLERALNIFKSQSRNEKVYRVEQILRQMKKGNDPSIS